jgi:hypothetical protein
LEQFFKGAWVLISMGMALGGFSDGFFFTLCRLSATFSGDF